MDRIDIDRDTAPAEAAALTRAWVDEHVPEAWRKAAADGGAASIRNVRSRAAYEEWYPTFAAAGVTMLCIALIASWLPTRQISRINPVETLRD